MNWSDHMAIAAALEAAHPDVNRLALDRAGLVRLVVALEGFDDAPDAAGGDQLDAIMAAWIGRDADDGEAAFDPHA